MVSVFLQDFSAKTSGLFRKNFKNFRTFPQKLQDFSAKTSKTSGLFSL
jgi:hypothetical protein